MSEEHVMPIALSALCNIACTKECLTLVIEGGGIPVLMEDLKVNLHLKHRVESICNVLIEFNNEVGIAQHVYVVGGVAILLEGLRTYMHDVNVVMIIMTLLGQLGEENENVMLFV